MAAPRGSSADDRIPLSEVITVPPRPTAVLFDFAGTLFDDTAVLTPAGLVECVRARGGRLGLEQAADVIGQVLGYADAPDRADAKVGSDLSADAHRRTWTRLIAESGPWPEPIVDGFYDRLTDNGAWRPYPDVGSVLATLAGRGVRLGLVSNIGWDIRPALARSELLHRFDAVILSCEVGLAKPDERIFRLACDRMGIRPAETLFVGDDPVKDGAAVRAGLAAYVLPSERAAARPRGCGAILPLFAGSP